MGSEKKEVKYCPKCDDSKDVEEFGKNRSNKDGLADYCRICHRANSTKTRLKDGKKFKQILAKSRAKHREQRLLDTNEWRKKNPDKVASHNETRRSLKKNAYSTLTSSEWREILEDFNYQCVYCPAPYEHMDHFIPLSKGGTHTADNVVPACAPCNYRKKDMMPLDFIVAGGKK